MKEEFMEEIEILNRFSGSTNKHLVSLLTAYQRGTECALIFPWAHCNLKDMWSDSEMWKDKGMPWGNYNPPVKGPGTPLDKKNLLWILLQCRGIASGLVQIHHYETTESRTKVHDQNRKLYGRHGDIKPENILLYRNRHDPDDLGTLVITDFGLTRFHSETQRTYFRKREIPATPTYRPPECVVEDCYISRSFDIWSYGCVLLEFVAWYLGGRELVQDFVNFRRTIDPLLPQFDTDQFFDVTRPQGLKNSGVTCATVKVEVIQVCILLLLSPISPSPYYWRCGDHD